ncbi:MAG: hypothetical protein J7K82_00335 [Thermoproteales archaeon]|nr:hypothetical protein [Thermoproteales archaeon]
MELMLKNTGSSTIKLYIETFLPVYKKLNTDITFDEDNKSIIRIGFEIPPVGALPFSEIYNIRVLMFHSGNQEISSLLKENSSRTLL